MRIAMQTTIAVLVLYGIGTLTACARDQTIPISCVPFPIRTRAVSPAISADSACVLARRGLRTIGELRDGSRGVLSTDVSAVDSVSVFSTAIQVARTPHIDSFLVVTYVLRRPYDAEVSIDRGTGKVTVRRVHKAH